MLNQTAVRQQANPGIYQMMLDAAGLLTNQTLGLEIEPLRLVEFQILPAEIDNGLHLATGKLTFKSTFTLEPNLQPSEPLQGFNLRWLQHAQNVSDILNL